jgi:hypothetical protein
MPAARPLALSLKGRLRDELGMGVLRRGYSVAARCLGIR